MHLGKTEKYSCLVLVFIFCISMINYIDRQSLFALFPLIQKDLNLTDTQLGFLGSAFMIVYMCFAPFVGYIGDRVRRPAIIGLSAVFWSAATFLSGLARGYPNLLLARSAVGIGEAGYGTVSPAYLAEWFPEDRRARVLAVYTLAIPAGTAVGYILGGILGQHFGWRNAFFIVGVPGMFLGLGAFFLKEIRPPSLSGAGKNISLLDYRALFKNRTFLLICLAHSIGTFSMGALAAWMPTYFVRFYGLPIGKASVFFGGITVAAGLLGTLMGGWLADFLRKKRKDAYFIVGRIAFFIGAPVGLCVVFVHSLPAALTLAFFAELFLFCYSGPYHAAIVETVSPAIRSMAFAVEIFIIHLLGDALSPALLGKISDLWNLKAALTFAMVYLLAGGAVSWLAGRTYIRDFAS